MICKIIQKEMSLALKKINLVDVSISRVELNGNKTIAKVYCISNLEHVTDDDSSRELTNIKHDLIKLIKNRIPGAISNFSFYPDTELRSIQRVDAILQKL